MAHQWGGEEGPPPPPRTSGWGICVEKAEGEACGGPRERCAVRAGGRGQEQLSPAEPGSSAAVGLNPGTAPLRWAIGTKPLGPGLLCLSDEAGIEQYPPRRDGGRSRVPGRHSAHWKPSANRGVFFFFLFF